MAVPALPPVETTHPPANNAVPSQKTNQQSQHRPPPPPDENSSIPALIIIAPSLPPPAAARFPVVAPAVISQEAVNALTAKVWGETESAWLPNDFIVHNPTTRSGGGDLYDVNIERFCGAVTHLVTGEVITQYKKLAKDPVTRDTWMTGLGKDFGRMAQGGTKTGTKRY